MADASPSPTPGEEKRKFEWSKVATAVMKDIDDFFHSIHVDERTGNIVVLAVTRNGSGMEVRVVFDQNHHVKTETVQGKCPMREFSATLIDGKIILFGGYENKTGSAGPGNDIWSISLESFELQRIFIDSEKPIGRIDHKALRMDSKLIILGGSSDEGCIKDMWMLDFAKGNQSGHQLKWENINWKGVYPDYSYSLIWNSCQIIGEKIWAFEKCAEKLHVFQFSNKTWKEMPVMGLTPSSRAYVLGRIGHLLILFGLDDDNINRVFGIDTTNHQNSRHLECFQIDESSSSPLLKSRNVWFPPVTNGSTMDGKGLFFLGRFGKFGETAIFQLTIPNLKIEIGSSLTSTENFFQTMKNNLSSGQDSDMELVVGKNKNIIPVHKFVMRRSPWINRCLSESLETSIMVPDCEREEVSIILELIYTTEFKRPEASDWKMWLRLVNALWKFEIKDHVDECYNNVKLAMDSDTFLKDAMAFLKLESADNAGECGKKQCTICFEPLQSPFQAISPCGHATTCADCIENIRGRSNEPFCPVCREPIVSVFEVYL